MNVRVQYFGYIKNMLNKKEDNIELDEGANLSDLLDKLAEKNGAAFRKDVYEPGLKDVKTGFSVTVNGTFMKLLGGVDAKLSNGDTVT
ncbi:MAG: MoaD/ThiS family protein, partial [Candidatus Bathyarchaeota archaeon]|nr:MoaD/ThiS family protein [Candidatus Bathyarchaeota archaeon]